jgi:outer membrane immunogenic protein
MRTTIIAATALAALGMGGAAQADGMYSPAKAVYAPAPAYSWNGLYLGLGIGVGSVDHEISADSGVIGNFATIDFGGEGAIGTVQIGYDRTFGDRFLIGAFLDYDFSDVKTDVDIIVGNSVTLEHSWSLGIRLGYLVNPDTLVYGLLAYTQAEFDTDGILLGFTDFDDFDGITVGGGLETRLHGNWYLKGEYRYTEFDDEGIFSTGALGGIDVDTDTSVHSARAVLTYKFGSIHRTVESLK